MPCVRARSSWPQPVVPCAEFHEPLPPPLRSDIPTWPFAPVFSRRLSETPLASLVQLFKVGSRWSVKARRSGGGRRGWGLGRELGGEVLAVGQCRGGRGQTRGAGPGRAPKKATLARAARGAEETDGRPRGRFLLGVSEKRAQPRQQRKRA